MTTPETVHGIADLGPAVRACHHDVPAALRLAEELGRTAPLPGSGQTRQRWELLAAIAAEDVTVARILEPHLDALAILAEAGQHSEGISTSGTWGVFAAEGRDPEGRPAIVRAEPHGSAWELHGTKVWCSLAGRLDHALISARTPGGGRRLFAIDLDDTVQVLPVTWHARGLAAVPSGPITLTGTVGHPVGDDNWYLQRPGFHWGGLGVAACWWGGAAGVAHGIVDAVRGGRDDAITLMHLGIVDVALAGGRLLLDEAARAVDNGSAGSVEVERTRAQIAEAAETVARSSGHALGPTALAFDDRAAGRVADLLLYVRQHHAERDLIRLGAAVAERSELTW